MRIVKVYDNFCPICEKMSKFDREMSKEVDNTLVFDSKELGVIVDPDNFDEDDCLVAQFAERYACNPDYTIDLPVYVILEGKKYVGVLTGEQSAEDFKRALKALVNGEKDS